MEIKPASVLSFPGLEIRQSQRRVFQDGEVNLTCLEYSTLVFLVSNPGIVLTKTQIFETVWNMDSDSCHSSVFYIFQKPFYRQRTVFLTPQGKTDITERRDI
ncbi:MAG: winged helix-turn-helix domain-containing protein [Lachnospiraceae bacterium]